MSDGSEYLLRLLGYSALYKYKINSFRLFLRRNFYLQKPDHTQTPVPKLVSKRWWKGESDRVATEKFHPKYLNWIISSNKTVRVLFLESNQVFQIAKWIKPSRHRFYESLDKAIQAQVQQTEQIHKTKNENRW